MTFDQYAAEHLPDVSQLHYRFAQQVWTDALHTTKQAVAIAALVSTYKTRTECAMDMGTGLTQLARWEAADAVVIEGRVYRPVTKLKRGVSDESNSRK